MLKISISKNNSRSFGSILCLVQTIFSGSTWLLGRSLKMVFILQKEMFSHILKGAHTADRSPKVRYVFNHFGYWVVDLNGLIQDDMSAQ